MAATGGHRKGAVLRVTARAGYRLFAGWDGHRINSRKLENVDKWQDISPLERSLDIELKAAAWQDVCERALHNPAL